MDANDRLPVVDTKQTANCLELVSLSHDFVRLSRKKREGLSALCAQKGQKQRDDTGLVKVKGFLSGIIAITVGVIYLFLSTGIIGTGDSEKKLSFRSVVGLIDP